MPQQSFLIRLSADQIKLLASAAMAIAQTPCGRANPNDRAMRNEELNELAALSDMLDPSTLAADGENDLHEGSELGEGI